MADQSQLKFAATGGIQAVKLTNKSEIRLVVKTRCSNNKIFDTVEIGQTIEVRIRRLPGGIKEDKVAFEWLPLDDNEKDLAAIFRKKEAGQNKLELKAVTK